MTIRNLVIVLGDQLDEDSAAFDGFESARDVIWMCEAPAESHHVWSHKARIAIFLSAMRHFRAALEARGWSVDYSETGTHPHATLAEALASAITALRPERLIWVEVGDWRLARDLEKVAANSGLPFEVRVDLHFLCPLSDFESWMKGRKQPRLEHFYRWIRSRTGVLMTADGDPEGGQWNYDHDNRSHFGVQGPGFVPGTQRFEPDATTREVFALVEAEYADHPGSLSSFDWPLTRDQAREALADFVEHRLPAFGLWQDALWDGEPLLWHSRLSAAMNLKLISPREVIAKAIAAFQSKRVPLASVEGFVRQIIGWREFMRGLYWNRMPQFLNDNVLDARESLPPFYWTGKTDMHCLHVTIGDTLAHGYAHHIQRLMISGLFALLLGVEPRQVHEWYLAIYVDAVEWVELPNTIGMSQYADGGLTGSKPYIASGKYIARMSNYCKGCRYDPALTTGPRACPFTILYWDFLARHRQRFAAHPRLMMQVRNLDRINPAAIAAIRAEADAIRVLVRENSVDSCA